MDCYPQTEALGDLTLKKLTLLRRRGGEGGKLGEEEGVCSSERALGEEGDSCTVESKEEEEEAEEEEVMGINGTVLFERGGDATEKKEATSAAVTGAMAGVGEGAGVGAGAFSWEETVSLADCAEQETESSCEGVLNFDHI